MRNVRRVIASTARRYCIAATLLTGAVSSCNDNSCCDPFTPIYYAVAYGTVTQAGQPASGIEVRGEVFPVGCPASGTSEGLSVAQSGDGGAYRLVLSSTSQDPGQCLRLNAAQGDPVVQTLTEMPFSSEQREFVRDSIRIDISLP
jgi:hypothetical protein